MAETAANLSFIIHQTKVVLDPARRVLKKTSKNIKFDSEEETDFEIEINEKMQIHFLVVSAYRGFNIRRFLISY